MLSNEPPIGSRFFQKDVKAKIVISGLAFSNVTKAAPEIFFLRHVPDHQLTMTITRIERGDDDPEKGETFVIPLDDSLSIEVGGAILPGSFSAQPMAGEFRLTETINLNDLHDGELKAVNNLASLTRLVLHQASFSTIALSRKEFQIINRKDGSVKRDFAKVGDMLVGKIKGPSDGSVTIRSRAFSGGKKTFPGNDGGQEFLYDIRFHNHCTTRACNDLSDFRHYYEVFKDSDDSEKKFDLVTIIDGKRATDIAACNPVWVDPPAGP